MNFTLTLNLNPGTTYAEIQRQVFIAASKLPVDSSKPGGKEEIHFFWPGRDGAEDVSGQWVIDK
jgi:hypothetical protein